MLIENYAVHLAFSTFPAGKERDFVQKKRDTFDKYVQDIEECMVSKDKIDHSFYKPLVFHLFGTFDVVFISLIDNYKFCQKVFDVDTTDTGSTTSYQIVTGICERTYIHYDKVRNYFPSNNQDDGKLSKAKFVHITSFKVNNGLLIGNGNNLIHPILEKLHAELGDSDYILLKSFNWSEIVLIQFGNDLVNLQKNVVVFREYSLNDICDAGTSLKISKDSLYGKFYAGDLIDQVGNSHIFVDSHSYSGVDYFEFNTEYEEETNPYTNDLFKSSIEFQVKPGHFNPFFDILKDSDLSIFEHAQTKFKNGKTDYIVKEKEYKSFVSNYKINQILRSNHQNIRKHIGRIKTNFLLDICDDGGRPFQDLYALRKQDDLRPGIINFGQKLSSGYTIKINDLKSDLKKIGVSRQLREKILKSFTNYNNLIKDTILYSEFIELRGYLQCLKGDIDGEVKRLDRFFNGDSTAEIQDDVYFMSLGQIEKKWTTVLEIFEDAYHNRVHNNYLYEDLNEFSIDFNSAVNQINSIHDFIVKTTNNLFFPDFKDQIIVTQNEIDSKSNALNVNYNVYHYLEPSLIFTTLMKEVMNGFSHKVNKETNRFDENHLNALRASLKRDLKPDLNKQQITLLKEFEFFYFFSDLAKFSFTFLFDYDLYEYWSWSYFLQNSSMYNASGLPDNAIFQQELLRISLIKTIFKPNQTYVRCPAPELFDLWQKNIKNVTDLSKKIVNNQSFQKDKYRFAKHIFLDPFVFQADGDEFKSLSKTYFDNTKLFEGEETTVLIKFDELLKGYWEELIYDGENTLNPSVVFKYLKCESLLIERHLKTGDSIPFDKFTKISSERGAFYFICAIGNATLKLFKRDHLTPYILRRDWQFGEPLSLFAQKEVRTKFVDPFGGFFYNCPDIRGENFGYINTIIDCLWNAAVIDKKRLFNTQNK